MEELEFLRDSYYNAITKLSDEDDIRAALPKPSYTNFNELAELLLERLKNDIEFSRDELFEATDPEDKSFLNELIKASLLKIKIIEELLLSAKKTEAEEEEALTTPNKKIILATTASGRIYLDQDLKDISEHYYSAVSDCLKDIENGRTEENEEFGGKYTSINKKLSGIHKAKRFKIRVYFKVLSKDLLYVMIARMKKADLDSVDRDEIESRAKNTKSEFEYLKEKIKNEDFKNKLIEENDIELQRLYKELGKKKYGGV